MTCVEAKKNIFLKHLSELSNTYCISVIWVRDIDSKSVKAKKNVFFGTLVLLFRHVFDFSDMCCTDVIQMLDTATRALQRCQSVHYLRDFRADWSVTLSDENLYSSGL